MPWVITRDGLKSEGELRDEAAADVLDILDLYCVTCGCEWSDTLPTTCPNCD